MYSPSGNSPSISCTQLEIHALIHSVCLSVALRIQTRTSHSGRIIMASTEYKETDLIVNFSLVDGMPEEI